jgi:hypothetical protein
MLLLTSDWALLSLLHDRASYRSIDPPLKFGILLMKRFLFCTVCCLVSPTFPFPVFALPHRLVVVANALLDMVSIDLLLPVLPPLTCMLSFSACEPIPLVLSTRLSVPHLPHGITAG